MNLILDIGNTRVKLASFEGKELVDSSSGSHEELENLIRQFPITSEWSIAVTSVSMDPEDIGIDFGEFKDSLILNHKTSLPFDLDYDSPQTLGLDRICGAAAAFTKFNGQHALVIDIGTCITYDVVDSEGVYRGGGISPGFQMRLKAMNQFTERLPYVNSEPTFPSIGKSTNDSILFGASQGMLAEIQGIINSFKSDYQNLKVIITGGDAPYFEQHIENPIFAAPNLVLEGLNYILLHNQGLHA